LRVDGLIPVKYTTNGWMLTRSRCGSAIIGRTLLARETWNHASARIMTGMTTALSSLSMAHAGARVYQAPKLPLVYILDHRASTMSAGLLRDTSPQIKLRAVSSYCRSRASVKSGAGRTSRGKRNRRVEDFSKSCYQSRLGICCKWND
jgi:hypothetical protein